MSTSSYFRVLNYCLIPLLLIFVLLLMFAVSVSTVTLDERTGKKTALVTRQLRPNFGNRCGLTNSTTGGNQVHPHFLNSTEHLYSEIPKHWLHNPLSLHKVCLVTRQHKLCYHTNLCGFSISGRPDHGRHLVLLSYQYNVSVSQGKKVIRSKYTYVLIEKKSEIQHVYTEHLTWRCRTKNDCTTDVER